MTYAQEGYRFRNDDQGELGATWINHQDAPQIMFLRATVNEPGGIGTTSPRRAGINVPSTTQDLFIAAHVRPYGVRDESILSKFNPTPQRSCYLMLWADGGVIFGYSVDGTAVVDIPSTIQWFSSVHSYPIRIGQSFWVGAWHRPFGDVIRETRFYVGPTRETLLDHQFGTTVTFGTNGIIYDSTAEWTITQRNDGGFHFNGDIYSVEAYSGPSNFFDGTMLLNPNFSDPRQGWAPGMTYPQWGKDDVGNVWTIDGDHAISGGIRKTVPLRVRTLLDVTGDPASAAAGLMYKRVDEPDSEWRII